MRLIIAALPFCMIAADRLENWRALPAVALNGETHHVQGIDVDDASVWVSAVDTRGKRGLLFRFDRTSGKLLHSTEVQDGDRFHPGGISLDGDSLWVPVAEYRRSSTTRMEKRNRQTLAFETGFDVADHIGAVAVVPEGLVGANWDARELYVWTTSGQLRRRFPNPTGVAIQDMKYIDGTLVSGGLRSNRMGVVVWLEWPGLKELRRIEAGRTNRGVPFTQEGLAVRGGTLFLLPEDGPSRLFAFELPPTRN